MAAEAALVPSVWIGTEKRDSEPTNDDYESLRVDDDCPHNLSIDEMTGERFKELEIESIESVSSEAKSEVLFVDSNVAPNTGMCLWAQPYDSLIHGPCKIELILSPVEVKGPGIILRAVYDTDKYRQEIYSSFFS